jgi:AdoMet-dependent rRNA methyltransferase SPB1
MGKHGKAKDRLDKYFYMAKEHGYRSRAAFKLIQINRRFDFLTKSKCLVDLCAAPGGWLQVAAKYMPISSIKVGIDLDPIRPVKGCATFQCDITTSKCISIIRSQIKHFDCDVVLNDGAPNVGAQWNKDAYNQSELVLAALKVATQVLKKGGTFVSKVFRSKDYNSLIWVLNQLFNKVEVVKPAASRSASAEIFLVCLYYKKPASIDPKFLDPKHIFADIADEEEDSTKKITSLKKLLDSGVKNRSGYDDDGTGVIYKEANLSDFLRCKDPYKILARCHKINIDDEYKNELIKIVKPHKNLKSICDDLKVLGKSDLTILLKFRSKYMRQTEKRQAKVKKDKEDAEYVEPTPADIEKQGEDELNKALEEKKKEVKKKERKLAEILKKKDYIQKMSVMTSMTVQNNVSLHFSYSYRMMS